MRASRFYILSLLVAINAVMIQAQIPSGASAQSVSTKESASQERCKLSLSQSPELRGFRLGMEFEKALEHIPSSPRIRDYRKSPKRELGERTIRVLPSDLNAEASRGVLYIVLEFLDDKITSITVYYDGSVKWTSPQEFFLKVAEGLGIPKPELSDKSDDIYTLEHYKVTCDGFAVDIDYGHGAMSSVRIYDLTASGIIDERRAKKEEKERQTFKP